MKITTTCRWAVAGCCVSVAVIGGASLVAGATEGSPMAPPPTVLAADAVVGLLANDTVVPLSGPGGALVRRSDGDVAMLDTTKVERLHDQLLQEHPGGIDQDGNAVTVHYGDHLEVLEAMGAITYVDPASDRLQRFCTVGSVEAGTCSADPVPAH